MATFSSYVEQPGVFSPAEVAAIREPLLRSPLVAQSTLGGSFRSSRGFAVTFRGSGRATLEERFPYLAPYLLRAIDARALQRVKPLLQRFRPPNAWYLNLLLVSAGGTVGRHVDGTLRGPSGDARAVPVAVTVLYLAAPGGELVLSRGTHELGRVTPREGAMVWFRGDLDHAVEAFWGEGTRASLVLEQYHFDDDALGRLPEFKLDSRAGFQAYLDVHAGVSR
jgi:hypothetical protein